MKKEMFMLKHPYVGTEHLLLAILHSDFNITKELLNYGLSYDKFRNEIINVIGVGNKANTIFLYTPMLKRVIDNAMAISRDSDIFIDVNDLFLSLLDEGEGIANRILLGMNIDIDFLYEKFKYNNFDSSRSRKLLLEEFSYDMNEKFKNNGFDPVLGRNDIVDKLIEILLRKNKCNPILVGEAGVGKTAIVEELVRRIENKCVPRRLLNCHIFCLSLSSLIAGTKYRGEFEDRINQMISEIESDQNIIIFIDEIHTLIGAGGAEGAIDASNILKPYLARGNIKIIGATTLDEYVKYIECEKALSRRFQKILVNELSIEDTRNILYTIKPLYEQFHSVIISDEQIDLILELTSKYLVSGKYPDKAIDILDEICTKTCVLDDDNDNRIKLFKNELLDVLDKKNNCILNGMFDDADNFRRMEKDLNLKIENCNIFNNNEFKLVSNDIVYKCIYDRTKIPFNILNSDGVESFICNLKNIIFGQDDVIEELVIKLFKKYTINSNCPFTCLFVGKSGVGKTFLAEELSKKLIDMSFFVRYSNLDFSNDSSVSKIIGAPVGYVGYKDNNCLVNKIKNNPFSIVLFDDIDKYPFSIINFLMDIVNNGKVNAYDGSVIDFRHAIFIFTCSIDFNNIGFGVEKSKFDYLDKYFDKLFINSLDIILKFNDLDLISIEKIVRSINNDFSTEFVDKVISRCDYKKCGAKKIKKIINELNYELVKV